MTREYPQKYGVPVVWLDLSENTLTGPLPDTSLAAWDQLIFLDLSGNEFSGTIPRNWSLPPTLRSLRLARNRLVLGPMLQVPGLNFLDVSANSPTAAATVPTLLAVELAAPALLNATAVIFACPMPVSQSELTLLVPRPALLRTCA